LIDRLSRPIDHRPSDVGEQDGVGGTFLASRKMETVGRLAGGVAHDINNILMIIVMQADLLLEDLATDDPLRSRVKEIIEAVDRGSTLLRPLLAFSRGQSAEPQLMDMNASVERLAEMLRRTLPAEIEIETSLADGVWPTFADPGGIDQVIINLALNARDAMPHGGRLTLATKNVILDQPGHVAPGDYVELRIGDGATEHRQPSGGDSGLGLSACRSIVNRAFGIIELQGEPGKGPVFRVLLPRLRPGVDVRAKGSA
jgi:signal transduction histidine kinase